MHIVNTRVLSSISSATWYGLCKGGRSVFCRGACDVYRGGVVMPQLCEEAVRVQNFTALTGYARRRPRSEERCPGGLSTRSRHHWSTRRNPPSPRIEAVPARTDAHDRQPSR